MSNTAAPLLSIFGTTDHIVPMVLEDLTGTEARTRARGDAGPSIAWHLGHLLSYRSQALRFLGHDVGNPYEAQFGYAPATAGDDYPSVSELGEQWSGLGARLREAIEAATNEALASAIGDGPHAEQTVQDHLAFLGFHEGFHLGGIAAIQKSLGKQTPSEKIMAKMQNDEPS